MISPINIEQQIENYKLWIQYLEKYLESKNNKVSGYGRIMQLETREFGWTDDKIIEYLKWLKFLIDTDLEHYFHNDKELFFKVALINDIEIFEDDYYPYIGSYMPYRVDPSSHLLGCSLGRSIIVRLGDLAIVPCHRTSYPKFILGYYEVKDDKIVDVSCNNFPLANAIYVTSFLSKPKCTGCSIEKYCTKYCLGSNYEQNKELFYPEETNCNLQKATNIFLYLYYQKIGIKNYKNVNDCFKTMQKREPEVVTKWSTIIQQII